MVWLATQGHRVIGVELSDIAVREFFQEGGQTPARSSEGPFEISSAGPFNLYCGDFFDTAGRGAAATSPPSTTAPR